MDVLETSYQTMMEQLRNSTNSYNDPSKLDSVQNAQGNNTLSSEQMDTSATSTATSTHTNVASATNTTQPDISTIQQSHSDYLNSLIRQCFLTSGASGVSNSIEKVIVLCDKFVGSWERIESLGYQESVSKEMTIYNEVSHFLSNNIYYIFNSQLIFFDLH